jgi:hypothetical protein
MVWMVNFLLTLSYLQWWCRVIKPALIIPKPYHPHQPSMPVVKYYWQGWNLLQIVFSVISERDNILIGFTLIIQNGTTVVSTQYKDPSFFLFSISPFKIFPLPIVVHNSRINSLGDYLISRYDDLALLVLHGCILKSDKNYHSHKW